MNHERERRLPRRALPLGIVLLVLTAVAIGIFLPSLFSAIQSSRLEGLTEAAELGAGELSLTSDEIKIERLALPQVILLKQRMGEQMDILELTAGRFMDANAAADKLDDLLLLIQNTGLDIGSLSRKDFVWAEPVLIVTGDGSSTGAVFWAVDYSKTTGPVSEELSFLVDESTGLVNCAEYRIHDSRDYEYEHKESISADNSANYLQTITSLAENMQKVYNFAQTEVTPQHVEGELSPFQDIFYIYFVRDGETRLSMPVWIEDGHWAINLQ